MREASLVTTWNTEIACTRLMLQGSVLAADHVQKTSISSTEYHWLLVGFSLRFLAAQQHFRDRFISEDSSCTFVAHDTHEHQSASCDTT